MAGIERLLSAFHVAVEPFAICEVGGGWRMDLDEIGFVTVHYVLAGHGTIEIGRGQSFAFAPDTIIIVPRGMSIGKLVTIEGFVTVEQTVKITIEDPFGNTVFQTNVRTTESGEFDLLWRAQLESVSGTYSVIVKDSFEKTTSTIFDL